MVEKHRLKCELIQDILPLYVEELTSQVTNQEIEEHIAECETCRAILERMMEPEQVVETVEEKEKIEILKVAKKKNRKQVLLGILVVCIMVFVGVGVKLFLIGSNVREESVICTVKKTDDVFHIEASLTDSGLGFVKTQVLEGEGFLRIELKTALVSPLSKGEYETEYTIQNPEENQIMRVYIGDRIVWEEGHNIPQTVFRVYQTQHESVEDVSANAETVAALQMENLFGSLNHNLTKTNWTMTLEEMLPYEIEMAAEEKMEGYAYVLMALIDNLEVVRFEYMTEEGEKACTFNTEDAMTAVGKNIKSSVRSAKDLLMLLRKLDLEEPSLDTYKTIKTPIHITVNSDLQLNQMVLFYFLDGNDYGTTRVVETSEGMALNLEEEFEFAFPEIDWTQNTSEQHTIELAMDLITVDGTTYHVQKTDSMPFELENTYEFVLKGNETDGFWLE